MLKTTPPKPVNYKSKMNTAVARLDETLVQLGTAEKSYFQFTVWKYRMSQAVRNLAATHNKNLKRRQSAR
jgi:hypothetical protein